MYHDKTKRITYTSPVPVVPSFQPLGSNEPSLASASTTGTASIAASASACRCASTRDVPSMLIRRVARTAVAAALNVCRGARSAGRSMAWWKREVPTAQSTSFASTAATTWDSPEWPIARGSSHWVRPSSALQKYARPLDASSSSIHPCASGAFQLTVDDFAWE